MVLIAALVLNAHRQTRKHSRRQMSLMKHLIKRYGFCVPILIDNDNVVISGALRVAAADALGLESVPAVRVCHLTEPEVRGLKLADNRIAELATTDLDAYAAEILELRELHMPAADLGLSEGEIDVLIDQRSAKPIVELNDCPPTMRDRPAISRFGEIWRCDEHAVACGDARDVDLVQRLMGSLTARMICTDPPYGVPIAKNVSGLGKIKHGDFAMMCGEQTDEELIAFLYEALQAIKSSTAAGALFYVFMDDAHLEHVFAAARQLGLEKVKVCVWAKTSGGMGSFYRSQTEFVIILKKPGAQHINNIQLGRFGRNRTTLWRYEGANSINPKRRKELAMHPTVKNAVMIADAIMDCTNAGDIVFDGFLGSGTTLIAAEDTRRVCYGIEFDPYYLDVVLRRYRDFTGNEPIDADGLTFREREEMINAQGGT